jgi:hypothetical protein
VVSRSERVVSENGQTRRGRDGAVATSTLVVAEPRHFATALATGEVAKLMNGEGSRFSQLARRHR